MMNLTSIILLTMNEYARTKECIESIKKYTNEQYELIVIDNGSKDDTITKLQKDPNIQLVCNEKNTGFAGGCNQGIKLAKGNEILLINNDTIVSLNWLTNLRKVLYSSPDIGIVGPMTNMALPDQTMEVEYSNVAEFHAFAKNFNKSNSAKWKKTVILSGVCMLMKKELIEKIGLFDDKFLVGNYEDVDLSYRANQAGYSLLIAGDTFIHHYGHSSFTKNNLDISSISNENRKYFIRKWGVNPEKLIYGMDRELIMNGVNNGKRSKLILFSHVCTKDYITGSEKYLLLFTSELQKYFDCHLVVPNEGVLSEEMKKRGIPVTVQFYPCLWSMWQPHGKLMEEYKRLEQYISPIAKLIERLNPEFVMSSSIVNVIPAIAAKKAGKKTAWLIHEVLTKNNFTKQSLTIINNHTDLLIGVSNAVLEPFKELVSLNKYVMYPSLDEDINNIMNMQESRRELGLGAVNKQIVGYVSADIIAHKGLEQFIKSALLICANTNQVDFLIVGHKTDIKYFNQCVSLINQSNYKHRFHFISFVKDINKVYQGLDILVVPSLVDEGFGQTALEGLAHGKAVVAFRSGGLGEILSLTNNEDLLAGKGDIYQLSNKVMWLLNNDNLRKQRGEKNKVNAFQVFGIHSYRQRMDQIVRALDDSENHRTRIYPSNLIFPEGTLLKGSGPTIYLIENNLKRPIVSQESFEYFRFQWNKVIVVADKELDQYLNGKVVDHKRLFPLHAPKTIYVKGSKAAVYLVKSGICYAFSSKSIFSRLKIDLKQIINIHDQQITDMVKGLPIASNPFEEHELVAGKLYVRNNGEVYFADQTLLRKVPSNQELKHLKLDDLQTVPISDTEFYTLLKGRPLYV
ncbi:glycosyltransferase [Lederbergia lenta]|uniref:Glycosyl transferase family protein n=2 Tax=Lederbergia lenta TaxID=1467 RepID=A0A2X4WEN0_LEDLE|nr:glycosyltransferase [Lederbergia lenta]SQI61483.1 glycosyl transferase family protein [Lederbergia lenta]